MAIDNIVILAVVIVLAGILGGLSSYCMQCSDCKEPFSRWKIVKRILVGVAASSAVPLFLKMLSSNWLKEAEVDQSNYFVIFGFCVVAAIYSQKFLQAVARNIFPNSFPEEKRTTDLVEPSVSEGILTEEHLRDQIKAGAKR